MNILDKPYNRSKRLLRELIIALLDEMPFHSIAVKDICQRADLTRTTFYRQYVDKYALLDEVAGDFFAGFADRIIAVQAEGKRRFIAGIRSGCHPGFVEYFRYLRQNKLVFRTLLGEESGVNVVEELIRMFEAVGVVEYTDHMRSLMRPHLRTLFVMAALAETYVIWAKNGMVVPDEEMAKTLTAFWAAIIFPVKIPEEPERKEALAAGHGNGHK